MEIVINPQKDKWDSLAKRPALNSQDLHDLVAKIISNVRARGDQALIDYAAQLDRATLTTVLSSKLEIDNSEKELSNELKAAIELAYKNIEAFHLSQIEKIKKISPLLGVTCWRKSIPISSVGLYIPGGSAPLFSTLLMLGIPAKLAGCKQITVCTPPNSSGEISPAILYTAKLLGIERVYKAGGAQAIAAMAYGTESISQANKIFGPGNQYVTEAKLQVSRDITAIDLPAGPSEVLVLADQSANKQFVAADLISQAEHGSDSQAILATDSEAFAKSIVEEIDQQLKTLPRAKTAKQSLAHSKAIVFSSIDLAVEFSNKYAPEHLIINARQAQKLAEQVINAGSVFIGAYTPEAVGDYASGTNHTLPTAGWATSYSGVSLDSFVKKVTFQEITREGLEKIGPAVQTMASAESLEGHKQAVTVRLQSIKEG